MEIHQLRYFVAVSETGNFSRAAKNCHVAQPSLSQQIKKLEETVGQPLFERQTRGTTLTPAGWLLLPYARRILNEISEATRRVGDLGNDVSGRLAIGVLPTIAPYLLPQWLEEFSHTYPKVELTVQEEITPRLLEAIGEGEIDLALLSLPLAAPFLESRPLFSEAFELVVPVGHPLATARTVAMGDLARESFILLHEGHCLSEQALDFCHTEAGFTPKIRCRSAQLETLLALIRAGMGVSLVPQMAIRSDPGLVYRKLSPEGPRRQIGLTWHRTRFCSSAAKAFISWGTQRIAKNSLKGG
ncbi:MAG TPA: LysR substrate-binding domain-containing protein [Chthoniobacteraceae bacterium]|nr:LysR substrate-binding domain-containing protein [Chthoniobacteraceae bacterium]